MLPNVAFPLLAAVEIAGGLMLLVSSTRVVAAVLVAALGLAFAGFGAVGWRRGSRRPCGCLGGTRGGPLGPGHLMAGAVLASVLLWNLLLEIPMASVGTYAEAAPPLAAAGTLALCAWLHRRLATSLVLRLRAAR